MTGPVSILDYKDVTKDVMFGNNDDEHLSITKCVCGVKFESWDFIISIYPEGADTCSKCGRRLFFRNTIHVYEVMMDKRQSEPAPRPRSGTLLSGEIDIVN